MRRQFATLAVAALLLVAGCTAFGGGGGTGADADPLYETPLDTDAVVDAHAAGLRDAGTFTLRTTNRYDEPPARTVVIRGDLDTGALYAIVRTGNTPSQVYRFANGTAYERSLWDGRSSYANVSDNAQGPSAWVGEGVRTVLELYDVEYAGTTTEDGETVYVYEANGPSSMNQSVYWFGADDADVKSANATLRIRESGVVTYSKYAFTVSRDGETQSVSVTRTFSNLGDTDLSPPAWIPTARNATA